MRLTRLTKLLRLPEQAAVTITYSLPSLAHNPEDREGHKALLKLLFPPAPGGEVRHEIEGGIVYTFIDGQLRTMMAEGTFRRFRGE